MPKLRRLSGNDLLRILSRFGFHPISQRGSHVKVRRTLPGGTHQTLTVVLHDELDKGTSRDLQAGFALHSGTGFAAILLFRMSAIAA
jgi:predicted RNA binding protein YcfA (HicA-like mRNA interferase family)